MEVGLTRRDGSATTGGRNFHHNLTGEGVENGGGEPKRMEDTAYDEEDEGYGKGASDEDGGIARGRDNDRVG